MIGMWRENRNAGERDGKGEIKAKELGDKEGRKERERKEKSKRN